MCLLTALISKNKKISYWSLFWISLFFTPTVGIFVGLVYPRKEKTEEPKKEISTKSDDSPKFYLIVLLVVIIAYFLFMTSCANHQYENPDVKEKSEHAKSENENNREEDISIVKIETGYDPEHNTSNLWLPCIAIKFKNISDRDINDYMKITAIFIDNSNEEQIGTEYVYLATPDKILLSGTSKQISLTCSIGWYAIQNQSVTAKIYMNKDLVRTVEIEKREFEGMIR